MTPSLTPISSPWEWHDDWISGLEWSDAYWSAEGNLWAVGFVVGVLGLMGWMIRARRR